MIKNLILHILYLLGLRKYEMRSVLKRLSKRDLQFNTVIDVGASDGCWSILCNKYLDKKFFLIEANPEYQNGLLKLCNKRDNFQFLIAAAGDKEGSIFLNFTEDNLFGGTVDKTGSVNSTEVKMIRLDDVLKEKKIVGPFLLKLDTHGFEVPIIEGAKELLEFTEVLIIEVYNHKITENSIKFYQICTLLDELGFYPIDLAEPTLRPYDNSFWQMDLVFVKKSFKAFEYNKYK